MIAMRAGSGFKTKKSLKTDGIGRYAADVMTNPSIFDASIPDEGKFTVVGPSMYDRKWYAEVWVSCGKIYKVT